MFATDNSFRVFVGTATFRGIASTIAVIAFPVFGSTTDSSRSTGLAAEDEDDELLAKATASAIASAAAELLLARTGAFDLDLDLDLDPDPDLDRDFRVDTILYSTFRYFRAAFVAAKRTPPQTVSAIAIFRSYFFKIE